MVVCVKLCPCLYLCPCLCLCPWPLSLSLFPYISHLIEFLFQPLKFTLFLDHLLPPIGRLNGLLRPRPLHECIGEGEKPVVVGHVVTRALAQQEVPDIYINSFT